MSKTELRLTLDRADHTFHCGETVTGMVEVAVDSECLCQNLIVEPEWRTSGNSVPDSESWPYPVDLFWEKWLPGRVYRYPFHFTAPSGPATYHGQLFNVDWYVRAIAGIPWVVNPLVEQEISLRNAKPASSSRRLRRADAGPRDDPAHGYEPAPETTDTAAEIDNTTAGLMGIMLLGIGLFLLMLAVPQVTTWRWPQSWNFADVAILFVGAGFFSLFTSRLYSILAASRFDSDSTLAVLQGGSLHLEPARSAAGFLMLAVSFLVGLGFLWLSQALVIAVGQLFVCAAYMIVRTYRHSNLGLITIHVSSLVVNPGGAVLCEVKLSPPKEGTLLTATATLSATEGIETGWRQGIVTHRCPVYEESFPFVAASPVDDDGRLALKAVLHVPVDAPTSFSSRHHVFEWKLDVAIKLEGSPCTGLSFPITVCSSHRKAKSRATSSPLLPV